MGENDRDSDGNLEERIRRRAYELWVEAGEPEGSEMDFWLQAEREIAGQDAAGAPPAGEPK
jgi:hypothetical protein